MGSTVGRFIVVYSGRTKRGTLEFALIINWFEANDLRQRIY